MMHKVYKLIFMDLEKEEKWLNQMASKGLNFVDNVLFRYIFEDGTPGEYIYRIELLEHAPSSVETKVYFDFLSETGVECVSTSGRWAYFRRKAGAEPFDLYSDYDAKIKHYKRNISLAVFIMLANIFIGTMLIILSIKNNNISGIPSLLCLLIIVVLIKTIIAYSKKIMELKREKQVHE